jgi:hypothetical protein
MPDGPLAERGDRGALALARGRGLPGDLAEERPDRLRGQLPDLAVVMGGEGDQVSAVGADRVTRLVRVRQVGEEIIDVAGERVAGQDLTGDLFRPGARSCLTKEIHASCGAAADLNHTRTCGFACGSGPCCVLA